MFEVVESIPDEPIRIVAAPDSAFRPGLIGQFCEINGVMACGLSNGSKPIGIVDDYKIKTSWFDPTAIIRLWTQRMVFRTDEYDTEYDYRIGMPLYVNKIGQLTSKQPKMPDSLYVARVITPPAVGKPFFEALWL